jgi:hypothetical protein
VGSVSRLCTMVDFGSSMLSFIYVNVVDVVSEWLLIDGISVSCVDG